MNARSADSRYCDSDICSLRWLSVLSLSKLKRLRRSVVASRTFSPGNLDREPVGERQTQRSQAEREAFLPKEQRPMLDRIAGQLL